MNKSELHALANIFARHAKSAFESAQNNPSPYSEAFHTCGIVFDCVAADLLGTKPSNAIRDDDSKTAVVHVHCGACDWDGMGDPDDPCYNCKERDTLKEVDTWDECCVECGQRRNHCKCSE